MSTKTTDSKFHKSNGELTMYAFGCGYVQSFTEDGSEYYGTRQDGVALSRDGVWHVRFRIDGEAHWFTFDEYSDARTVWIGVKQYIQAKINVKRIIEKGDGS